MSNDSIEQLEEMFVACSVHHIPEPRGSAVGRCSICGQVFYFNFETEESSWDHPCVRMGNLGGEGYSRYSPIPILVGWLWTSNGDAKIKHFRWNFWDGWFNHPKFLSQKFAKQIDGWIHGPNPLQDAHYRALLEEHRKGVGTSKVGGNGLGNGLFWAFLKKNHKTREAGRIMAPSKFPKCFI